MDDNAIKVYPIGPGSIIYLTCNCGVAKLIRNLNRTLLQKCSAGEKESNSCSCTSREYPQAKHIVEQQKCVPELTIDTSEIEEHRSTFESQAIIWIFNYFWPKPMALFHSIFTNWTMDCEIHLCSKGFFIVKFPSSEARDIVLRDGQWF